MLMGERMMLFSFCPSVGGVETCRIRLKAKSLLSFTKSCSARVSVSSMGLLSSLDSGLSSVSLLLQLHIAAVAIIRAKVAHAVRLLIFILKFFFIIVANLMIFCEINRMNTENLHHDVLMIHNIGA